MGGRRFPVEITFLNDLQARKRADASVRLDSFTLKKISHLLSLDNDHTNDTVSTEMVKAQYFITTGILRSHCKAGSAVLVFVPGLEDIVELQSRIIAQLNADGCPFRVMALHSMLPLEDQVDVLQSGRPDEVKVIIATNIAESSITIPDVDVVICFGLHKEISNGCTDGSRKILRTHWISQSSAMQRAGRTGRVRPGKVFRLYSKNRFSHFDEFPTAEMVHSPLQEVVLTLKSMFNTVTDVMKEFVEPPPIEMIKASFGYLHSGNHVFCKLPEVC